MFTCHCCGRPFSPQASAWGYETCGDCLAQRIQELLTASVPRTRRPMRRAGDLAQALRAWADPESKKASNG